MLNHRREPGARPPTRGEYVYVIHSHTSYQDKYPCSSLLFVLGHRIPCWTHSRHLIAPHYDDGFRRTVLECCRLQALICCHSRWPSSGLDIVMVFTVLHIKHQFRVMMQREYNGSVSLTFDTRISAAQSNNANSSISQS